MSSLIKVSEIIRAIIDLLNKKRKKGTGSKDNPKICRKIDELSKGNLEDITYQEIDSKLNLNEPTYCFCKYISFGNMIKCDNEKVS